MFWTGFGLTCGAMVLGTAAAYANPPVVYASPYPAYAAPVYAPPVVYQQSAPNVVYVQAPQPQTVYVQAPQPQTVYVQAPQQQQYQAPQPQYQAPQQQQYQAPATTQAPNAQSYSVRIQNDNGSTTVVPLTQGGLGWYGPQGEYYPYYPSVEDIKARYGK